MDFLDGLRSLAALNIMSSQLRFLAVRAAVHVSVWNAVIFLSWWKCHKVVGSNGQQSLKVQGNL